MKRTAFLLKSFVTMALLGWTTMSHAQRYEIDRDRVYFGEEVVMQADAVVLLTWAPAMLKTVGMYI